MSLRFYLIETSPHSVFDEGVTHNLGTMADKAGIYEALWYPKEAGIKKASELARVLAPAISDMKARPGYYRAFESARGFGTYNYFLPWLDKLYAACLEHPDAEIESDI